jgi:hypothetical protein
MPVAEKGLRTFSIPQLTQARAALSRTSVIRVVECLSTSPVPNNYMEADAFGNMHKTADLASGCQVLLHKNLTSSLYRPIFC